jgi:DNA-binding LytR/AlgR family response regulator
MLSCFVIDDEPAAVDILTNYIEKTPFLTLVGSTNNPIEAIQLLQNQKIDLVFLDIQMPYLSGLDLMKVIQGKSKVILTTAHSEYALEGFEQDALDYLLKPIPFERFLKAAQKALYNSAFATSTWQAPPTEDDYIFVKTEKGKMIKINFNEIMYVEGLKNYLSIYTKEDRIITLLNVKDLEERLPPKKFMRVHKSYIVSLDRIKAVDGNQILLKDMKAYVPLGETYRTVFFQTLQQYVMNGKR